MLLRDVPGVEGEVPKASILKLVMSGEWQSSKRKATDRLRRVAGKHKFKQEQPEAAEAAGDT
jgi:hypothetical protein